MSEGFASRSDRREAGRSVHSRRPIRRLAVVNRGEAAVRCIRAVRALREEGEAIESVALFTPSDRAAPHVSLADRCVELPVRGTELGAFLDHEILIGALRRAEADAAWPGWGFVSEDPLFAERLASEGILFLGPSADVLRALGDKISAKRIAEAARVPVAAWSRGAVEEGGPAESVARRIGYPLMVKAAAGGGGRGIRRVERPQDLEAAIADARAEAHTAFGDSRVFLEACLEGARHIEVQIAGDHYGVVASIGCRDCSVQRRSQKLIEEAPPPGLELGLRRALEGAALRIARQARFVGVGTVEFMVSGSEFSFMEVNPRLQVEHGVTEVLTGVDLVRMQIRISRGDPLELAETSESGHAIEARVCAEDPQADFAPAPGRVVRLEWPTRTELRVDSGVEVGSEVLPSFDSLVAKVIATGPTREDARCALSRALRGSCIVLAGGTTNRSFLVDVLESDAFREGGVVTTWLDAWRLESAPPARHAALAFVCAAVIAYQTQARAERRAFFSDPARARDDALPPREGREISLRRGRERYELHVARVACEVYRVRSDDLCVQVEMARQDGSVATLRFADRAQRFGFDVGPCGIRIELDGESHLFDTRDASVIAAPSPAVVVSIGVAEGEVVSPGQRLGVLEAMKLEIPVLSPCQGRVTDVRVAPGDQVAAGAALVVVEEAGSGTEGGVGRVGALEEAEAFVPLFDRGRGLRFAELLDCGEGERARRLQELCGALRGALLGFDVPPGRGDALLALLGSDPGVGGEGEPPLLDLLGELDAFADVEPLFAATGEFASCTPGGLPFDQQLRLLARSIGSGGKRLGNEFHDALLVALRHYEVTSLRHDDALEDACLRLLVCQRDRDTRRALARALLDLGARLARAGVAIEAGSRVASALASLAEVGGDVLAERARRVRLRLIGAADLRARHDELREAAAAWISERGDPDAALRRIATRARGLASAEAAGRRWLVSDSPRRRIAGAVVLLSRWYRDAGDARRISSLASEGSAAEGVRLELSGGRVVLGAVCASPADASEARTWIEEQARKRANRSGGPPGLELLVADPDARVAPGALLEGARPSDARLTATLVSRLATRHATLPAPDAGSTALFEALHPELRVTLGAEALEGFDFEPGSDSEEGHVFMGRARRDPSDTRLFALCVPAIPAPADPHDLASCLDRVLQDAFAALADVLETRDPRTRYFCENEVRIALSPGRAWERQPLEARVEQALAGRDALGIGRVVVRLRRAANGRAEGWDELHASLGASGVVDLDWVAPATPVAPASRAHREVALARRRGLLHPDAVVSLLTHPSSGERLCHNRGAARRLPAQFLELRSAAGAGPGDERSCAIVAGIVSTPTDKFPEGLQRVLLISDPTRGMGALAGPECDRIVAALDLAEAEDLPLEWIAVSSGAKIAMDSGTENLDATARVVRRIVEFTQRGGVIHVVVAGVNVGAQSYFDALATMLMHTRGVLIQKGDASMVLTGAAALAASGSVSADTEARIGGYHAVMGPNGQAQYFARDLAHAYEILYRVYAFSYVAPGERAPRLSHSHDPETRRITEAPYPQHGPGSFRRVGEIFDDEHNRDRKRPFDMRTLLRSLADADGDWLERWSLLRGGETAIVGDAHVGGMPCCLIGIESHNVSRSAECAPDGPDVWTGGTLFPMSSKKVARALNAASGNRPAVVLGNLSGFDGSPESMRNLQLEYGAEIARSVVNFRGPLLFLVVARHHGGAYVVFSRALNDSLWVGAVEGSFASVIGGAPAARVVFAKEVERRVASESGGDAPDAVASRDALLAAKRAEIAGEFDAVHTVERALDVGSLHGIVPPERMRPFVIRRLRAMLAADGIEMHAPASHTGTSPISVER